MGSPEQTDFILNFSGPQRLKIKSFCSAAAPEVHLGSPGLPGANGFYFELFGAPAAQNKIRLFRGGPGLIFAPPGSPEQTDFILSLSRPERPKIKSVCSTAAPWAHFGSPGLPGANGFYFEPFKARAAQNKIRLFHGGSLDSFWLPRAPRSIRILF